jgi:hypothetical protein
MNLARHAAVLWRFRAVTVAGLIIGLLLAVLASYKVPSFERRGTSVYTSDSQILVTQRGFPEGRVVLPSAPPASGSATGTPSSSPASTKGGAGPVEFADPGRFINLTDLYTQLITSDQVLGRIPGHPPASMITAQPLPGNSNSILPIISLSTVGPTAEAAHGLNVATVKALRGLLADEAATNKISQDQLVELSMLKAPSRGTLVSGPGHTASILALLLCLIGTVALVHLLESLRNRKLEPVDDVEHWDVAASSNGVTHADEEALALLAGGEWLTPDRPSRRTE